MAQRQDGFGAVNGAAGDGGRAAPYPLAKPGGYGASTAAPQALSGVAHGASHGAVNGAALDAAAVIARLEEAGMTLLALPSRGPSTALRQSRLDVMASAEAYGWSSATLRPPVPSAARISRMDEAWQWLTLIPPDRVVLRRIAGARALVHPITERHVYSWRKLAALVGADHKAMQRWHAQAIALIVAGLNAR
jgi:hypothetical protein